MPIHFAAFGGSEAVIEMLVNDFEVPLDSVAEVRA